MNWPNISLFFNRDIKLCADKLRKGWAYWSFFIHKLPFSLRTGRRNLDVTLRGSLSDLLHYISVSRPGFSFSLRKIRHVWIGNPHPYNGTNGWATVHCPLRVVETLDNIFSAGCTWACGFFGNRYIEVLPYGWRLKILSLPYTYNGLSIGMMFLNGLTGSSPFQVSH